MEPFIFMTSVESVQLTGRKAANLMELYLGLQESDGPVLYHHTHRFYRSHSFLGPWDRSDFALWVSQNLKEEALGERMGAIDPRDYRTLAELRADIMGVLEPVLEDKDRWVRSVPRGMEFHFCRSVSLVLPTSHQARNLEEFTSFLEEVDTASLYYHLIEAPLHLHGLVRAYPNDFSQWLDDSGFPEEARKVSQIDPFRSDLEALRRDLLAVFRRNRLGTFVRRAAERVVRSPEGEAASLWLRRWRKGD